MRPARCSCAGSSPVRRPAARSKKPPAAFPGVARCPRQFQVLPRRGGDENPPPREGDPVEPRRAGSGEPASSARAGVAARRAGASQAGGRPGAKPAATGPAGLDKAEPDAARRGRARAPAARCRAAGQRCDRATGPSPSPAGCLSAFEAMIVYRAAQQTPGVREVVDRLEFDVPDEDHPNPLLQKGRPEDLEPYPGIADSPSCRRPGSYRPGSGPRRRDRHPRHARAKDRIASGCSPSCGRSRCSADSASKPSSLPSDVQMALAGKPRVRPTGGGHELATVSDDARRIGKI